MSSRRHQMDASAVGIRMKDAHTRLDSAEFQLAGDSPHEWKHAAEIAVSAGIAASDAVCGHVLGYKIAADSHRDAVTALREAATSSVAKHLEVLVAAKSTQSYGDRLPTRSEAERLVLHARRLVEAAANILRS
ncbi:hypothetical protein [Microbacterium sp. RURRCA19A]|uniref:hypothetical protein n=1 Tax=Microbacterium sp. RURRCA19A TaxID=1907391 RepID=UPI00111570B7|nr:hypothetical protein [Microbacterium sp. RURRCA19A]